VILSFCFAKMKNEFIIFSLKEEAYHYMKQKNPPNKFFYGGSKNWNGELYFLFQTNKLDVQNEKTIPLTNIKCQFFLPQLTTPPHDI
jgi:hypothetical protein